jgi:hypothetical protein
MTVFSKERNAFPQKPLQERKWSARLTHGYMDGGATICAESTRFSSAKNLFFADENEIRFIWAVIRSAVLYSA